MRRAAAGAVDSDAAVTGIPYQDTAV
jgi:hypothetical protein